MEGIDLKTILVIGHVFSAVLGMGGALASDFMFFSSIRDEIISHTEFRFLKLGSSMTWAGIILLVLTGLGLFLLDPAGYMESTKFLAKMAIVGVIIINGIFFHRFHIPCIERHCGAHFPSSDEFTRRRPYFILSGVISVVSWASALILGSLRSLDYSALTILGAYVVILLVILVPALFLQDLVLPHHKKRG